MPNQTLKQLEQEMNNKVESLKEELAKVRTGRANPSMLDSIKIECYGSQMLINQLATVTIPEARTIEIKPWDVSSIVDIEKGILKSDLGLNPSNDGKLIRIILPTLTEETRNDLVKYIKKVEEGYKVSIRSVRRDGIDTLKNKEKEKQIAEDDYYHGEQEIQKLTDKFIVLIDSIIKNKEKEIMEV